MLAVALVIAVHYLSNHAEELIHLVGFTSGIVMVAAYALPFVLVGVSGFFIIKGWWNNKQ